MGPVHGDIFFQDRYLLNGVDLKLKFHRSKNSFRLMAALPDRNFRVKILEASLYVRKVVVSPAVALAHAKTLESATAKYPLHRVEVKTFSIPQGNQSFTRENLFLGQIPRRVVIGMVDNTAFNPFNTSSCLELMPWLPCLYWIEWPLLYHVNLAGFWSILPSHNQ